MQNSLSNVPILDQDSWIQFDQEGTIILDTNILKEKLGVVTRLLDFVSRVDVAPTSIMV